MSKPSPDQMSRARQGRTASLVIAGSMLFWIAAQWIGPQIGLAGNYAILIDLIVLAALFWALVVSVRLWRKRNDP
ncbi:DUF5337 domain-containing protein [Shimia ponticola]|uniref:DUF5337 domain-containing protein n=1 Tax=Shimia ponticola TaxID=2582893 RepID=UPI002101D8B8|nr:DUF5337 domain-containing protein [Shimia ponticola]